MKASARNRFVGQVAAVLEGNVSDEVELLTPSGLRIVASITRASLGDLGLQRGATAFALVRASSILLVTDAQGERFSARNQFQGAVSRVVRGAVNSEVSLALMGDEALVASVTNESVDELDLSLGQPVLALFSASCVVVGVPA